MTHSHMPAGEFRKWGYRLIDWIANYWETVESRPVQSPVDPGEIRAALPPLTDEPTSFEAILRDFEKVVVPGLTHWQSPSFFGYFPANCSGPSVLGELLSAGLGTQGMLWSTSPAMTELETFVLDELVGLLGLPERYHSAQGGGGVIQDTASSATLCALAAARARVDPAVFRVGNPDGFCVYTSAEAHSSVEKAVAIAGLGTDALRRVAVDDDLALDPVALEAQIQADIKGGLKPGLIAATVGTTSSLAVDPIPALAELSQKYDLWLHVDAALAGTATICPEHRGLIEGLEGAQSYSFNPHKWMLTNLDCSCFYVQDPKPLLDALSVLPEYLRNRATEVGGVIDYRDWQIPLGRRFRALKLWFVLRYYGTHGLRDHVRRHIGYAERFADAVVRHPEFELVAPARLNLVCFRHRGGDALSEQILERINRSGAAFLTHTRIGGHYAIRLAIGATATEEHHVDNVWELLQKTADELTRG